MKRKVIRIDDELCNGCGECIPNCPEGALQIIDEKARLVSDLFCDGLGACIGHCPQGAISIEEREAEPYDERTVMKNIVKHGANTVKAHLEHLADHGQKEYLDEAIAFLVENGIDVPAKFVEAPARHGGAHARPTAGRMASAAGGSAAQGERLPCGCPGSKVIDMRETACGGGAAAGAGGAAACGAGEAGEPSASRPSRLQQWPVQIHLVPPSAPYLKGADLLIAADCVPFAYAGFHEDLLRNKIVLVGCPKLDDAAFYREKLTHIFKANDVRSVTVAHMEVPCCFGLVQLVSDAVGESGKSIPVEDVTISVRGERM